MSNDYWTDRKQNQRLEEAEAQLASERRARSRLAEQMRAQQGSLQGQIDRLTRAFVALVEHEDIRTELGQYAGAAAWRRHAREVVATVIATGGAALRGSAEPADEPGYWLAAATRGVAVTARGETGGAELLAEAAVRDPGRTALFLALLAALTRDPRWAPALATPVLPDSPSITHAQRQVWQAITDDRLPDASVEALAGALTQQLTATGSAGTDEVASWVEARTPESRESLPAERAVAQLELLVEVLSKGAPAPAEWTPPAADTGPEDPLSDTLRSLITEGSPGEAEIMERMAIVRADMGFVDDAATTPTAWNATSGEVVTLLIDDLEQSTDDTRRALARRVLAPTLGQVADELTQQAGVPAAQTRAVEVVGERIAVTPDGAAPGWQELVHAGIDRRNPLDRRMLPAGYALLGVGALCCLLGFVAGGFVVLGVIGLAVGGGLTVSALRQRRDLTQLHASTISGAERQIAQQQQRIGEETERSSTAAARAGQLRQIVATELVRAGQPA